jgi:predicted molibdopterin-dependent oxidoreductase YjgC
MTNSFNVFSRAKMFFVIRSNMTEAHPVASTFVKNAVANGAKLIVADPERAAEISGISSDQIRAVARELASVKPVMLCYTLGITEHTCGKNNVMSVANLQMLLGNMGIESIRSQAMKNKNINTSISLMLLMLIFAVPGHAALPFLQGITNGEVSHIKFAEDERLFVAIKNNSNTILYDQESYPVTSEAFL